MFGNQPCFSLQSRHLEKMMIMRLGFIQQIFWGNSCAICYIFKTHFHLVLNKSLNESGTITLFSHYRSNHPELFLGKGVLKVCRKFKGEHPCQNASSIKLLCKFIEIALRHRCSPVSLLRIFRTPFHKNTSGRLLLALLTYYLYSNFISK